MQLDGGSALISGGAGGLGGATARSLVVELGMAVVIFEPARERAEALAAELGRQSKVVAGNQSDESAVAEDISAAQALGTFCVNVHAAGALIPTPATATLDGVPHDMAIFRAMIEIHLMGPFNVARLCAAAFAANNPDEDRQRGAIVNTASTGAFDGQPRQVAYAAAKSGIAGMTLAMARDLGTSAYG